LYRDQYIMSLEILTQPSQKDYGCPAIYKPTFPILEQNICQYDSLRLSNAYSTPFVHSRTTYVRIRTEINIPHINLNVTLLFQPGHPLPRILNLCDAMVSVLPEVEEFLVVLVNFKRGRNQCGRTAIRINPEV
jgi:hypothetical protein